VNPFSKSVTITLIDQPHDRILVATDLRRPILGASYTRTQRFGYELLRCFSLQESEIRYGAEHVPALHLVSELINPEGYGWITPEEVRRHAARVLGRVTTIEPFDVTVGGEPCELKADPCAR
jgi:hypothetical protein